MKNTSEIKIEDGRYLKIKYFNKSKMLFAFIAGKPYWKNEKRLRQTYLFANTLDESILDYYLFAEFDEGVELDEKILQYLYAKYETEDKTELYIFDLTNFKDDVDKFLEGSYSEFSKDRKSDVLRYNGYPINKKGELIGKIKDMKGALHFYTILNPDNCKDEIAEEMVEVHQMFDTKNEALSVLRVMKEVCEPYDKDKETYKKEIL